MIDATTDRVGVAFPRLDDALRAGWVPGRYLMDLEAFHDIRKALRPGWVLKDMSFEAGYGIHSQECAYMILRKEGSDPLIVESSAVRLTQESSDAWHRREPSRQGQGVFVEMFLVTDLDPQIQVFASRERASMEGFFPAVDYSVNALPGRSRYEKRPKDSLLAPWGNGRPTAMRLVRESDPSVVLAETVPVYYVAARDWRVRGSSDWKEVSEPCLIEMFRRSDVERWA